MNLRDTFTAKILCAVDEVCRRQSESMISLVNYLSVSPSERAAAPAIDSAQPKQTLMSD